MKQSFRSTVHNLIILSGNIRDRYPFPTGDGKYIPLNLSQYLAETLRLKGYERFLAFNTIDGFAAIIPRGDVDADARGFFKEQFKVAFDDKGATKCSLEKSLEVIGQIIAHKEHFVAVIADFASRYAVRAEGLTDKEHDYFTKALMLSPARKMRANSIKTFLWSKRKAWF